ncbi:MAG: CDP-alcohol phosphatidyltransferase family protein [Chloroflexota bacterium]
MPPLGVDRQSGEKSSVIGHLRTLPNQLTAIRLLVVPLIWVFALLEARVYVGAGLMAALITDAFDGMAARRLGLTSDFGSKFDSIADQAVQLSSIGWVLLLMPEIITDNLVASALALGTYLASLTVGLVKYRRLGNLHLYLSKVGGLFLYLFLIQAFLVGRYSQPLFLMAVLAFTLSSVETLALQLMSSEADGETGSILFRYIPDDHWIRRWAGGAPRRGE